MDSVKIILITTLSTLLLVILQGVTRLTISAGSKAKVAYSMVTTDPQGCRGWEQM